MGLLYSRFLFIFVLLTFALLEHVSEFAVSQATSSAAFCCSAAAHKLLLPRDRSRANGRVHVGP